MESINFEIWAVMNLDFFFLSNLCIRLEANAEAGVVINDCSKRRRFQYPTCIFSGTHNPHHHHHYHWRMRRRRRVTVQVTHQNLSWILGGDFLLPKLMWMIPHLLQQRGIMQVKHYWAAELLLGSLYFTASWRQLHSPHRFRPKMFLGDKVLNLLFYVLEVGLEEKGEIPPLVLTPLALPVLSSKERDFDPS